MSRNSLGRQLARSRGRMKRLRRLVARQRVPPDSPLSVAVEELAETIEEFSVALEQLDVANEELAGARHAEERHAHRYRDLFQSAPDCYLATDGLGVIREANRAAAAKLGREARYLVGKPLVVFLAEENRGAFGSQLSAIQREGRTCIDDWELRFAPQGVAAFVASVTAVTMHEPGGGISEIRWLVRDVTARRRAEESLRASEARARLMADSLPVLIAYIDREERYRFNNAMFEEWLGSARGKLVGRTVREILGDTVYGRVRGHIARALAGNVARFEVEFPHARDGSRHVSVIYAPHVAESGEVLGYYSLLSDVSEQRRMQEQLRAATAAAALAEDRERRRLAQDLHDDLGQLLSLAAMKLGALRDSAGPGDAQEQIRRIEELVGDAHAHTESLTFQLSPPILHDQGLVPAAEWLAEDLERRYDVRVSIDDDGAPKPLDEANRLALFRTLRELLINVARHAGVKEARVRIWSDGGRVHLEVRDHGLGFDPGTPGGGFGLLSAGETLRSLGGNLEIQAAPGGGARVVAELPIDAERCP